MGTTQKLPDFQDNLVDLQMQSFKMIFLFVAVMSYVWLMLLLWPVTGASAPPSAWLGLGMLTLSSILSIYMLDSQYSRLATYLLVWGIWGAVACVVLAVHFLAFAYLFILPIIFASVLLRRRTVFLAAVAASFFTLTIGFRWVPAFSLEVMLPVGMITLVSIASWLSARNLYTALAWVWNGYERARHNEQIARQRQAELRRVLKALDETTYRLERVNFMLKLAHDQAQEAHRLKQQFAQTISHELRTPLNLIVSFTELMAQSPEYYGSQLPPTYLRDLSIVDRNARHLQSLVNDVLDLARIEAAQMSISPEEVDPVALVEEAANTARSLVEAHGLTLHTEHEPGLPRLWLDPIRIRQVLFNLLNNAVRFTEQGNISISVRHQGEEVIFAVADTGVGIAPEDIPHIFKEFQQIDGSTRRRHEGAGLGLAISRQFVELHGGRIWVESQVGQGSTFYFSLPVNQNGLNPVFEGRSVTIRPIPDDWKKESILLVITPSPSAAALITRYVRQCRTVVVPDLDQGRRTAQQLMPQAVIIDMACQQLDPASLEELGRAWKLPNTPFMACPLPGEGSLRQQLAVEGYLLKPISHQSLWNVLRQFGEDVDSVLVVDDDRDFVHMLSRMLDNPVRRYEVIKAYSGQEGLAMLNHHRPDLVLLDLILPDRDGFQIIKHIRSKPIWGHTPIVIVSAQDEIDNLKPLTSTMLIAKTNGLMPGEIVQWVQKIVNTTVQPWLSSESDSEYDTVQEAL